jgi:LytS/YehU family sensor histidine kinase
MTDAITATLTSIFTLLGTASFMIVVALAFSNLTFFKTLITKKVLISKLTIGIVLGLLAIYGTLMGTKLENGTIINVRELAAMIAGVAGGPVAGLIAGLMGGLHRYTVGGATALPCTISTILIGVIAGLISTKLVGKLCLLKGAAVGLVLEFGAMGLILLLVQPFDKAAGIVEQIAIPMIVANAAGLVLWLFLSNKWKQPIGKVDRV